MTQKKIFIFSLRLEGGGGIEAVVKKFMEHFNAQPEFQTKLIFVEDTGSTDWCENLDFYIANFEEKRRQSSVKAFLSFIKFLYKEKPDYILWLHNHRKLLPILKAAMKLTGIKPKLILWPHFSFTVYATDNKDVTTINHKEQESYRQYDGYFAISSGIKDQLITMGVEASRIQLIFNPTQRIDAVIPKSEQSNHFIFIGRFFNKQKRIQDIIKAFSLIDAPYHLTLIGNGPDRLEIVNLIREYELEHCINLSDDWVVDPWSVIDKVDALILASEYEGFGLVLAESIARGIPCISSDCLIGPADIIKDNVNGYLYEPGNIEALKEKILNIIQNKLNYSINSLKQSIEPIYEDNYFKHLTTIFKSFSENTCYIQ